MTNTINPCDDDIEPDTETDDETLYEWEKYDPCMDADLLNDAERRDMILDGKNPVFNLHFWERYL